MAEGRSRPNILFVMDDQHRYDYLGSAGAPFVNTPNLDRIADDGVRFTEVTTNCPVCAPARIGLATGLQPSRLGCLDNRCFLPRSAETYYQRLRAHGYRVGCVGKLDLAKPDRYNGRYGDRPCSFMWGFTHPEECEGKESAGTSPVPIGPYTYHLHGRGLLERFHEDYRNRRGSIEDQYRDSVLPADAFEDAYIGRQATKWLEWVPDDFPWHLFVSFVGPHSPYDPPEAYADRYREVGMPDAIPSAPEGKPEWVKRKMRTIGPEEVSISRRQYCGAIEVIDDQVGAILKAIESRGMLDNTIVVFSSDHGDMLGDHGLYGKSVPYEASVRVPLTMAGPGIEGGRVSDALVELIDVNPTLCELAGLQPQAGIDGRSICPLLRGEARAHRTDTVSAIRNFRCIRTDRHKLVLNDNDLTELYDLHENPDELSNIAEAEPEVVRELTGRLVDRYTEGRWQH